MLASLGSTSAIHYLFGPYVLSLSRVVSELGTAESEMTGETQLEAKTLTIWGGVMSTRFKVDDARPKPR